MTSKHLVQIVNWPNYDHFVVQQVKCTVVKSKCLNLKLQCLRGLSVFLN